MFIQWHEEFTFMEGRFLKKLYNPPKRCAISQTSQHSIHCGANKINAKLEKKRMENSNAQGSCQLHTPGRKASNCYWDLTTFHSLQSQHSFWYCLIWTPRLPFSGLRHTLQPPFQTRRVYHSTWNKNQETGHSSVVKQTLDILTFFVREAENRIVLIISMEVGFHIH